MSELTKIEWTDATWNPVRAVTSHGVAELPSFLTSFDDPHLHTGQAQGVKVFA
jgi:hypothetical protein